MDNLIYKAPVPEEKAREELGTFLEYFKREEGIDNLRFFKAEDIVYDIVCWAKPHEPWNHCQKTYLVHTDGIVEEIDGFEFFELQVWKVFKKYPQKFLTTRYIIVAEIEYDTATICYTENTTAVQNKILGIISQCRQIKQKAQKFLAGR